MSGDYSPETKIEITPEMIEAAVKTFRRWEDSDEPDPRVMVKAVLLAVLGRRASFETS